MSHQFCTFTLDGALFGVAVEKAQEVLRPQEMTRVPLAPPAIRGLINLRGQIVPALDLRALLAMPARPAESRPMNVVVRAAGEAISFLVDDIGDVLQLDEPAFEPPPETLRGPARELIAGVYKLRDRLLLVLEVDRVATRSAALWR